MAGYLGEQQTEDLGSLGVFSVFVEGQQFHVKGVSSIAEQWGGDDLDK